MIDGQTVDQIVSSLAKNEPDRTVEREESDAQLSAHQPVEKTLWGSPLVTKPIP